MAIGAITAIGNAVSEVSKVLGKWLSSAQRRKMTKAIEAGEKYILTNESEDKNKKRKLRYYKKRFFKYN